MARRRFTKKEEREKRHIIATERKRHPNYSKQRLNRIAFGKIQNQRKKQKGKRR